MLQVQTKQIIHYHHVAVANPTELATDAVALGGCRWFSVTAERDDDGGTDESMAGDEERLKWELELELKLGRRIWLLKLNINNSGSIGRSSKETVA